jgi:hypothetical protein
MFRLPDKNESGTNCQDDRPKKIVTFDNTVFISEISFYYFITLFETHSLVKNKSFKIKALL